MVSVLSPDDILSRFLFYNSEINESEGVIKSSALAGKHPNGFSVFRTTNLYEQRTWGLGRNYVEPTFLKQSRSMLGRFDLAVHFYQEGQTTIHHAPNPHPRHYNIHGMPIPTLAQAGQALNLRQKILKETKFYGIPHTA